MKDISDHSKLNQSDLHQLIKCFAIDITATQTAKLLNINRNTVNKCYNQIRAEIFAKSDNNTLFTDTICEVDESYFGAKRIRGKAGRGAFGKVIVFGIVQRNGLVYTEIVSNTKQETLIPIIQSRCTTSCVINSDEWRAYDVLTSLGYTHNRIKHFANKFVKGSIHTNTIESYWSYCKLRLNKFHGLD